jgi:hypothetical protein
MKALLLIPVEFYVRTVWSRKARKGNMAGIAISFW